MNSTAPLGGTISKLYVVFTPIALAQVSLLVAWSPVSKLISLSS